MTPFIQMALAVIELAAEVTPHVVAAIKSNGELDEAAKAALIARVDAAKAKVAAYMPRDV